MTLDEARLVLSVLRSQAASNHLPHAARELEETLQTVYMRPSLEQCGELSCQRLSRALAILRREVGDA